MKNEANSPIYIRVRDGTSIVQKNSIIFFLFISGDQNELIRVDQNKTYKKFIYKNAIVKKFMAQLALNIDPPLVKASCLRYFGIDLHHDRE